MSNYPGNKVWKALVKHSLILKNIGLINLSVNIFTIYSQTTLNLRYVYHIYFDTVFFSLYKI